MRNVPPSAAEIIQDLDGDQATGMCRCPAHDDSKPSLHVSDGQKGAVWKCHAGCSQEDVLEALRARGIWPDKRGSNRTRPKTNTARDPGPDRRKEQYDRLRKAIAILRAADANPDSLAAYLAGRGIDECPPCAMVLPRGASRELCQKGYRAMVLPIIGETGLQGCHVTWLSRKGKTKLNAAVNRKMYGQAKDGWVQLADIDPDSPPDALVVGEGVESTLSAMQLSGLPGVAALSAANMSKLQPPEAAEYVIAADNDEPGMKAADDLAERLAYEGCEVRMARPRNDGEDWNDVLTRGDAAAREWDAAVDGGKGSGSARRVSALEESDFMDLRFPKRELLLAPWLPRPGLAMVYAPKGEGKTWFALAVGKAVAAGHDLLGWRCGPRGRVLYVEGELPGQSVQDRLRNFKSSPPELFHVLCRDTFLLRRQTMPDLADPDGRRKLDRIIKRCDPALIIIDTISTLVRSGVENDAESWAPIQQWLLDHRWQGRTVMLMHHSGKSGQQRGTSKREDVIDSIIALKKQPDECTETESVFNLTFTKSRDFFGQDAEPMRLRFAVEDGRAIWRGETLRDARAERIAEMIDDGFTQKEIARELDLSEGRVSQIKNKLKEEGRLRRRVKGEKRLK